MSKQGFCWECQKKLWGNKCTTLKVDGHVRILHVACAKEIKSQMNHKKQGEEYFSMMWAPS